MSFSFLLFFFSPILFFFLNADTYIILWPFIHTVYNLLNIRIYFVYTGYLKEIVSIYGKQLSLYNDVMYDSECMTGYFYILFSQNKESILSQNIKNKRFVTNGFSTTRD